MRAVPHASLGTVAREWGRIGLLGFGGPPAHIALLRDLTVTRRKWVDAREFEDAFAACNLLPGPVSTQMAIFTALRAGGMWGALVGGLGFILPGLLLVLAIAAVALADRPPAAAVGFGAGASAVVVPVVAQAGIGLIRIPNARAALYVAAGIAGAVLAGAAVVGVLLLCGALELAWRARHTVSVAAWPALIWLAFKVGALSYGGGYVIIPLMHGDAVHLHGWMTGREFADAVAYGQITPGPILHTTALVGWSAAGLGGALVATVAAFAPSFALVMLGARHFARLRESRHVRAFLDGAGPASAGAILGAAVPLLAAVDAAWQWATLAAGAAALALRVPPVYVLVGGGLVGLATTL
jgi:chromate transporter